jgi:hypothetical protein
MPILLHLGRNLSYRWGEVQTTKNRKPGKRLDEGTIRAANYTVVSIGTSWLAEYQKTMVELAASFRVKVRRMDRLRILPKVGSFQLLHRP